MLKHYVYIVILFSFFFDEIFSEIRILQSVVKCQTDAECGNGICIKDKGECQCNKGYITHNTETSTKREVCNYEQKSQLKAFLLELCVGFGAGNFYIERTVYAILKLIAFIFGLYLICLFPLTAKFLNDKFENECLVLIVSCMYYSCSAGLAFWYIYDLVNLGMNKYNDGNNVALMDWN